MNLQPPATLLEGAPGSGKTDALVTYIEAGIETFVIITEPGGAESLIDSVKRRNLDIAKLHWTTALPATGEWSAIDDMVSKVASMGYADLQNIKSGVGKDKTRAAAMGFLNALKDFKCERTGQSYGDTSKWGPERALCADSLSGMSLMSMALTIGFKPAAHQGEWGVAMNFLEQLLLKMTSDRQCFFTLTAHVEKEQNEITGVNQIMASTLGRKLAPKIPRFFSEVVYAKRTLGTDKKAKFTWATVDSAADLKNRALPISDDLVPSFVPIVKAYQERVKLAGGTALPPPGKPSTEVAPSKPVIPAAPLGPAKVPGKP